MYEQLHSYKNPEMSHMLLSYEIHCAIMMYNAPHKSYWQKKNPGTEVKTGYTTTYKVLHLGSKSKSVLAKSSL